MSALDAPAATAVELAALPCSKAADSGAEVARASDARASAAEACWAYVLALIDVL
jgi:hypothetical protein